MEVEKRIARLEKKFNDLAEIVSELCKLLGIEQEYALGRKALELHEKIEKNVLSK